MATSDNNWIDDIHRRLGTHVESPSPEVWDNISRRLDQKLPVAIPKRSFGIRLYARYAAEVAVIALVASLAMWIGGGDDSVVDNVGMLAEVTLPQQDALAETDTPIPVHEAIIHNQSRVASSRKGSCELPTSDTSRSGSCQLPSQPTSDTSRTGSCQLPQQPAPDAELSSTAPAEPTHKPEPPMSSMGSAATVLARDVARTNRFSISLYTNSSVGGSVADNYTKVHQRVSARAPQVRSVVGEKWHPSVPVSLGLSLGYGLTDRVSISAGLSYTFLRQQRDLFFSDGMVLEDKNTVSYLGLPINLSYKFARFGQLSAYASLGGKVEWAISNNNDLTSNRGPVVDAIGRDSHGVQWSANASIGLQYALSGRVALYVAPGVGYYFKEKGPRPVVYEKYPWAFQVEAGLKFDL